MTKHGDWMHAMQGDLFGGKQYPSCPWSSGKSVVDATADVALEG